MKELMKAVGERIKEAREERDLTQKELAAHLGYSPMGVSHFENGIREMKLSDLKRTAAFLRKPLSYFLASGATMFRAESDPAGSVDVEVRKSLDDFDEFLASRKDS